MPDIPATTPQHQTQFQMIQQRIRMSREHPAPRHDASESYDSHALAAIGRHPDAVL